MGAANGARIRVVGRMAAGNAHKSGISDSRHTAILEREKGGGGGEC